MVSLFNALNISSNALTVNESAISVVSHNVANMNTEGYSKQKVKNQKEFKGVQNCTPLLFYKTYHLKTNCFYG